LEMDCKVGATDRDTHMQPGHPYPAEPDLEDIRAPCLAWGPGAGA